MTIEPHGEMPLWRQDILQKYTSFQLEMPNLCFFFEKLLSLRKILASLMSSSQGLIKPDECCPIDQRPSPSKRITVVLFFLRFVPLAHTRTTMYSPS